ncbi:hypothetical protein DITRI_Ditri19aG0188400 [Diplodiscus trichospermus]
MALSILRRITRPFGPFSALVRRDSPTVTSRSCQASGEDLSVRIYGDKLHHAECFSFSKRFSTTVLTPDPSGGTFPSDLLSSKTDLVFPVTNFHNEEKGFMVLAGDVFNVPIRKDIIHRIVLLQLAKRQQGTHSTKTISEVSGTGRKPWQQKGSGRARHGTLRGPQFQGGATMHGPKPRSHAIKLNKKVRCLGLKIALSACAAEGKVSHYNLPCVKNC